MFKLLNLKLYPVYNLLLLYRMRSLLQNTRKPDITFNRDGRIFITARIARILSLCPGDAINIALLNDEYLLYATHNIVGRHEAQCYPTKKGSHNFCVNSIKLSRALLDICGIQKERVSFIMGEGIVIEGCVYCPIVTKKPL